MDGFARAVVDLSESDDPAAVGTRKRGGLRDCYSYGVTKSHRLLCAVDRAKRVVLLPGLGYYKGAFGRDNRS